MVAASTAIARSIAAEMNGMEKPDTLIAAAAETAVSLSPVHRAWAFAQFAQRGGDPVDTGGSPARTMAQLGVKSTVHAVVGESNWAPENHLATELLARQASSLSTGNDTPFLPSSGSVVPMPPLSACGGTAGLALSSIQDCAGILGSATGADTNPIEAARTISLDDASVKSAVSAATRVLRELDCEPGTIAGLLPLTEAGERVRMSVRSAAKAPTDVSRARGGGLVIAGNAVAVGGYFGDGGSTPSSRSSVGTPRFGSRSDAAPRVNGQSPALPGVYGA